MRTKSFKKSISWNKSYKLALEIYQITKPFPQDELYGLTSQMRRCSMSISLNIAEGSTRGKKREFAYFLRIAKGSAGELETQLLFAKDLGYISTEEHEKLEEETIEIKKILTASLKTINNNP